MGGYDLCFASEEFVDPHLAHRRIGVAWVLSVKTRRVPQLAQNSTQITRAFNLVSYRVDKLVDPAGFTLFKFIFVTVPAQHLIKFLDIRKLQR